MQHHPLFPLDARKVFVFDGTEYIQMLKAAQIPLKGTGCISHVAFSWFFPPELFIADVLSEMLSFGDRYDLSYMYDVFQAALENTDEHGGMVYQGFPLTQQAVDAIFDDGITIMMTVSHLLFDHLCRIGVIPERPCPEPSIATWLPDGVRQNYIYLKADYTDA